MNKENFFKKVKSGFTVVELLVVIAVIGLLASIVMVSLKDSRGKAETGKGQEFSSNITRSLGAYAITRLPLDGDIKDMSGNGLDGQWYSGSSPTSYTPTFSAGAINKGVQISGTNYIKIPANAKLNSKTGAITISSWFYLSNIPTNYIYPVLNYTPLVYYYYISINGSLGASMYDINNRNASFSVSASEIKIKQWINVVLTYNGSGTAKLFVNGKEFSPSFNTMTAAVRDTSDLNIGGYQYMSSVSGLMIDNIEIFDSYISLSEVRKKYAEGLYRIKLAEYSNNQNKE